ncbi:MAG: DNA polymerase III subunit delta [Gammaproteobacteria bacterium]|nr:DNA polymerase III subunit delta [Gammaproteobacteria bacterium]
MRRKVDQLHAQLKRGPLAPLYLIHGDEPLQLLEAADAVRHRARADGHADRQVLEVQREFDWRELAHAGASLSLFSERRIIELRLGGYAPGKEGGQALTDYCARRDASTVLLITADRQDGRAQQARWFKALDKFGIIVQVRPVDPAQLPDWIARRMERHGKRLEADAAELIAQRVEGNLLAACQEVDKLALLVDAAAITLADVARAVTDSARYEVFDMLDAGFAGHATRVKAMLRGLRQEGAEPHAVFGACMYQLRRLCAMAAATGTGTPVENVLADFHVWNEHAPAVRTALKRISASRAARFLREAAHVDRALKGAIRLDPWLSLEALLLRIAGAGIESPLALMRSH